MIDNKYFAGFVDADGSITVHVQKRDNDRYGLYPKVQVGQLTFRSGNLKEIAETYGAGVKEKVGTDFSVVELTGSKAYTFLNLIKNHLVIKDEVCEYILSLPKEVSKEELKAIKRVVQKLRKKNTPSKNFPSRRWMAGYIDGDGCFDCTVKSTGVLSARLTVACAVDATAGVCLISKQFGGNFTYKGNTCYYQVSLGVAKMNEIYDYCGKHLRIKKTQCELLQNYVGANKHSRTKGATYESNKSFQNSLATTKYLGRT